MAAVRYWHVFSTAKTAAYPHQPLSRVLAVREELQGQRLGTRIVEACLEEARQIGLKTAFALTYRPGFFEKLGFRQADVMTLPRKVWGECYRCPKFPGCNEIAVVREIERRDEGTVVDPGMHD